MAKAAKTAIKKDAKGNPDSFFKPRQNDGTYYWALDGVETNNELWITLICVRNVKNSNAFALGFEIHFQPECDARVVFDDQDVTLAVGSHRVLRKLAPNHRQYEREFTAFSRMADELDAAVVGFHHVFHDR